MPSLRLISRSERRVPVQPGHPGKALQPFAGDSFMSDTTAALLILPFLTVLVVALECSRLGCTRLSRWVRGVRTR